MRDAWTEPLRLRLLVTHYESRITSSNILQINRAIPPKIQPARGKSQHDRQPFGGFSEPKRPGRIPEEPPPEDRPAKLTPLWVAGYNQDGDDSDDLRNRLMLAIALGGE